MKGRTIRTNLFWRRVIVACMAAFTFASFALGQKEEVTLTVTDPARDGMEVGMSKTVKGQASVPSGHHVWVLVRREDFTGVWWPQAEGTVNPKTQEWKVQVTFGQEQDVGWSFDLAAVVVNDEESIRLQDYRKKAMVSGDWKPIEMPSPVGVPVILKVRKTSHK